jgi:hypothetical protein
MRLPSIATTLLVAALAGAARAAPPADGPYRHVVALAREIGPRKTGTAAERLAVDYVRREMEAAGLSVTLEAVGVTQDDQGERSVDSWNVIGLLGGEGPDSIVVAAHHDTGGVNVPGANDDASGLAVLLETARRTAARSRRVSYRFISFCAEEEGLLGSRHHVRGADLSGVRAMIALELVGRGELLVAPVPGPPPLWAQQRLLRAARQAKARGVVARPLWSLAPRLVRLPFTADHEAFLERGVPAFLLLGTYPGWTYHTTEDTVGGIEPGALARAVDVLDRLLIDLEAGPPRAVEDRHYLPLMLFGLGILVPSRALWIVCIASLLGWALLLASRLRQGSSRRAVGESLRVIIVTGAVTAIGLSGLFVSELLMERIHGVCYPWMAHQGFHVAMGITGTLVSGWLGLNLFRRIKPTVDPGPYLASALLIPVAAVAAAVYGAWPEIGAFMAWPIVAFLASRFTESSARKFALGLLGAAPFSLLSTLDDYRALIDLGGFRFPGPVLFALLFLLLLPFVLFVAHVASFQDCLQSRVWRWLSSRRAGGAVLLVFLSLLLLNSILPSYDGGHRQVVRVRQRIDVRGARATATIESADALDGVRLRGLEGRALDGTAERITVAFPSGRVGFEAIARVSGEGPTRRAECTVSLRAPRPADRTRYTFTSRAGFRVPSRGDALRNSYTYTVIGPQPGEVATFDLGVPDGADLSVFVRADFKDDLLGLAPAGGPRVFVHRGTIAASRDLVRAGPPAPAEVLPGR